MAVLRQTERHHRQEQHHQQQRKQSHRTFARNEPQHHRGVGAEKNLERKQLHKILGHRYKNDILMGLLVLCCCLVSNVVGAPSPGQTATATTGKSAVAGSGEVMQPMRDSGWLKGYEPSCDELRAMWRFSKRQSRASEITNEIPTYRGDPFTMNMWQPSKAILSKQNSGMSPKGRNLNRYKYDRAGNPMRGVSRNSLNLPQFLGPVYGRVLHKEPEEYGYPVQPQQQRRIQYRFPGPSPNGSPNPPSNAVLSRMSGGAPMNATPQRGSFMKLKELVWTERARELAQQRRNEEMLARAAVLKELANGGHGLSYQHSSQFGNQDGYYSGGGGGGGLDYNVDNGGGDDESSYYDSGSVPKLSHFRERNSFLQQQQQQQQQQSPQQANSNSKINFPSKHGRIY